MKRTESTTAHGLTICSSLLLAALVGLAGAAGAQMPGVPVLQNAFANPGITAALDLASAGASSTYGVAGAWSPNTGRFQLSGGVGLQTRSRASNRTLYGVRANAPVMGSATGSFGVSVFAGYGGGSGTVDSSQAKTLIPVGATASFRHAIGNLSGFSAYASPVFEWIGRGGGAGTANVFRVAIGIDAGITSAIGLTLGLETGQTGGAGSAKPSGTSFGGAISYALGR
ncbi:MAG TPA: hypothetical protein VJU87_08610 [Gemmatimonadaceae bacterium]|nr:hypothetical protein [Gemmatimonadaceae bacterium]